jgi:hypothetical protein
MSDGPPLAAQLAAQLGGLQGSVIDAESAFAKTELLASTRDDVVELTLIRALGLFEEFVGDLFLLAMQRKLGPEVSPHIEARSRDEAVMLIAGSDGSEESRYVAWMPFKDKTVPRAKKLLEHAQPFGRLSYHSTDQTTLRELVIVRNRVAHDSPIARAKFADLAREKGYPDSRAADFLTSIRGMDMEILLALARLESIARGLADATELGSREFLGTEDPFLPDSTVPPGTYECKRNAHKATATSYTSLGACAVCPRPSKCPHCGSTDKAATLWIRTA